MKKTLLLVYVLVLFISCKSGTGNYFKGDQIEDNTFQNEYTLEVQEVNVPDMEIANVWFIHYIDSLTLCRFGHTTGYFFKLFEGMENPSISTFMYEGRGPNEFLSLTYCDYYHKNQDDDYVVYFTDPNIKNIFSFNLSEYKRTRKIERDVVSNYINQGYYNPSVLSEDEVLYQDYRQLNKKHYFLLKEMYTDKLIKEIELSDYKFVHPFINISFSQITNNDASKIALACSNMNQIVIIDLDSDDKYIFSIDDELLQWDYIIKSTEEYIFEPLMYRDVKNIKDYIVANYVGNGEYSEFHILNWDGEAIARIKLPIMLSYFDYNKTDNHIYAFTDDDELYKFDLKWII